ncbi:hypothetical protein ACFQZ8_14245, partial [Micromonospora azadirachtae]
MPREPSTGLPTREGAADIDELAAEVAVRAVAQQRFDDPSDPDPVGTSRAPSPLDVIVVGQYDEHHGDSDDGYGGAVIDVQPRFHRSLEAEVARRIAELTGRAATAAEVRQTLASVRYDIQTRPMPDLDPSQRNAPPVELHYVVPPPRPPVQAEDYDVPQSDYLSSWRLATVSTAEPGWWRADTPVPNVDQILAVLPEAAFRRVDAESAEAGESRAHPELLTGYRSDVRYDVARVAVEESGPAGAPVPAQSVRIFRLRIHLAAHDNVADADVEAFMAHARAAVAQEINGRFRFPDGDQFHLVVEFTDNKDDAHHVVQVPATGSMTNVAWPVSALRAAQPERGPQRIQDWVLHEMMHLLGLPDEYLADGTTGGVYSVAAIFRNAYRDPDSPHRRRPDLPSALMKDVDRAGGPDIIAARYLWELAFVQESSTIAPLTTVRRDDGAAIEVVSVPADPSEEARYAALLDRMAGEHPAETNARVAQNWRYERDATAAVLARDGRHEWGRSFVMLPADVGARLVDGERFLLRAQSTDFDEVPPGYEVVVIDSYSWVLSGSDPELRFVVAGPEEPITFQGRRGDGRAHFGPPYESAPTEPDDADLEYVDEFTLTADDDPDANFDLDFDPASGLVMDLSDLRLEETDFAEPAPHHRPLPPQPEVARVGSPSTSEASRDSSPSAPESGRPDHEQPIRLAADLGRLLKTLNNPFRLPSRHRGAV